MWNAAQTASQAFTGIIVMDLIPIIVDLKIISS